MKRYIQQYIYTLILIICGLNSFGQLISGTVSPSSQTITPNTTPSSLSATAASGGFGAPPYIYSYQWQSSNNGTTWSDISGANSGTSYAPGNLATTTYYRLYTWQVGAQLDAYSNVATVTVALQAGIISPSIASINYNTSPGQLSGTLATGGNGTYAYQWQSSTDNSIWTNIGGATSQNYTPGNLTATTYYRRQVTSNGVTVSSNVSTVTIILQSGSITPISISINYNTSPGQLAGTAATGGNGTFSYQWQSSPDNSTWTNVGGATSQNYTPGNLTATIYYRRQVTSNGVTVSSNVSTITVYPQLQAGTVTPATLSINYNTSPGQLTGTVATGGNGTFAYQWQSSLDNSTWSNVVGATSQNYATANLTATTYYRRQVTSNGITVSSNVSTITVYPQLQAGSVTPTTLSINYNTSPGQLIGTVATGGNGTYTYQWQSSPDNSTWTNVGGATSQNYTPANLTATTNYRRQVTSNGITVSSNVSTITVYPQLQAGSVTPTTLSINYNTSPGQLTGTVPTGGNGTYTYQWQSSPDNSIWASVGGATSQNYTPANLTTTTYYRRQVTSNGATVSSNVSTVTVYPQLQAGTVTPASLSINYNTSPGQLSGTVPTGGNGAYVYQWQSSPDNSAWTNVSGATSQNYTPGNLTSTLYFRRQVTSNAVTVSSNVATIAVYAQLQPGSITPVSLSISYNTSPGQLTGTAASGGSGTYTYQWQSSVDNNTWTNISGAINVNYIPGNLTANIYYRRSVTSNGISVLSNTSSITVYPELQPGTITGPAGSINHNTVPPQITGTTPSGGSGTFSYQWQRSLDNNAWSNIAGATSQNYAPPALTASTFYRRIVTSISTATSNVVKISVYPILEGGVILPGSISIAANSTPGTMGINPAIGGNDTYTYQWQSSIDNFNWTPISGAINRDYTPGSLSSRIWYRRQATSNGVAVFSSAVCISILQPVITSPVDYSSSMKLNLVRSWEADAPEQNANTIGTRPLRDVKQTTIYFDGLGREQQQVQKQGSLTTGSSAVDFVQSQYYDNMGRQSVQYLPFAANSNGGNTHVSDGLFKRNPIGQLNSFGASQYPGENHLYSTTNFETSPLTRMEKAEPEGNNWVGSDRGGSFQYLTNTTTDDVKKWTVTNVVNNFGNYAIAGAYSPGELFKTITTDAHGYQQIEFKDKDDRVVLKKVQSTSAPDLGAGKNHSGWACNYYIYDDLGRLRCVVQPKGVELIQSNWVLTDPVILAENCFRYEFDSRDRVIKKKFPGAGEVWMVYDARDRVVLVQDANLRAATPAKWSYTQYDQQNRPIATGLWPNNQSQEYHAAQAENSTSYPVLTGAEELTVMHYDDYSSLPNGFSATANNSDPGAFFTGPTNTSPDYALPWIQSLQTIGLPTWTKTKVLGTASDYIVTVNYYDENERLIQVQSQNITGGISTTSLQYNFSGLILRRVSRTVKAGPNPQNLPICTKFTYDDLNRILKVESGMSFSTLQTISSYQYDAIGNVKNKAIGTQPASSSPMETYAYDYNIRGWQLGVNRTYMQDTASTTNYFGYNIGYEKDNLQINGSSTNYANKQFNGNISGITWKSTGDRQTRKFDYNYDPMGRMLFADFSQMSGTAFNKNAGLDFTSKATYDINGNILSMIQRGWKLGGSTTIDSLAYTYDNNNKVRNVIDHNNDVQTKLGDFRSSQLYMTALSNNKTTAAVDYVYDNNGNLIKDRNKDIGDATNNGITYNHLNLPTEITFRTTGGTVKGSISYTYDAAGQKLRKIVAETGKPTKTILYLEGQLYENDTLQFISHEEGRLRYVKQFYQNGTSGYKYYNDYFLKDHLGNVRLVLTEQKDTASYMATMEAAYRSKEDSLFFNIPETAYPKAAVPGGYPTDGTTNPNDSVAKVNGSGQKIGPSLILKVMSGDKADIAVKSFYRSGGPVGSNSDPVADLVSVLAGGIVGVAGETKGALPQLNNTETSPLIGVFNSFRKTQDTSSATKPRAYLNWILLDEQLKYVNAGSGAALVGNPDVLTTLAPATLNIPKNGFLYIYVSNETQNKDVFFDNLSIKHYTGPLLEETHYYPYGLTMAGISSKALGKLENREKFNEGTELNTSLDLNLYETDYRFYDPQLGRFMQTDELAADFDHSSPYSFASNNPILLNDPLGLSGDTTILPTVTVVEKKENTQFPLPKAIPSIFEVAKTNPMMASGMAYGYAYSMPKEDFGNLMGITPEDREFMDQIAPEAVMLLFPWGRVFKAGKWVYRALKLKKALSIAKFAYASKYGIRGYKALTKVNKIAGTQVHHLIEKRFASTLGQNSDNMLSIVLTESEHKVFTDAWRKEIGYIRDKATQFTTATATKIEIEAAARTIYKDYPDILKALGL